MKRMDEGMPFLLRYENVAWYENGAVYILDRRVYPAQVERVECRSYTDVVKAIQDMVTQSAGPYTAVGMGMALAAHESRDMALSERLEFLAKASAELAASRPTQAHRYAQITDACYEAAKDALQSGGDPVDAVVALTVASLDRRYARMRLVGERLAELVPDGGAVLTQCYGETIIGALIAAMKAQGKAFRAYCAETRPYMQGARLTASCFAQSGIDTTVLTDNMIAYAMDKGLIDVFTSAADAISMDGTIANKIGSLQMALLAKYYGIPYYVTGMPDRGKPSGRDIVVEMRDASQVLNYRGMRTAVEGVKAIYPAFDVVPPHLISGIVTDKGVFVPGAVSDYYKTESKAFY